MSRFVSVERLSADTLFARATSPEAGLDADARNRAEGPQGSSVLLSLRVLIDLLVLGLFLGAVLVWADAMAGIRP